jgi:hypothetical protein
MKCRGSHHRCGTVPFGQRRLTKAEMDGRNWLRHDPKYSQRRINHITPGLIVNLVPRVNVPLDDLIHSNYQAMRLYNKMLARVEVWLDKLDNETVTPLEVVKAFTLIAPILESIVNIRGKITDQRANEATDVTGQMKTDLEVSIRRDSPDIAETLRLMRDRFSEIRGKVQ